MPFSLNVMTKSLSTANNLKFIIKFFIAFSLISRTDLLIVKMICLQLFFSLVVNMHIVSIVVVAEVEKRSPVILPRWTQDTTKVMQANMKCVRFKCVCTGDMTRNPNLCIYAKHIFQTIVWIIEMTCGHLAVLLSRQQRNKKKTTQILVVQENKIFILATAD